MCPFNYNPYTHWEYEETIEMDGDRLRFSRSVLIFRSALSVRCPASSRHEVQTDLLSLVSVSVLDVLSAGVPGSSLVLSSQLPVSSPALSSLSPLTHEVDTPTPPLSHLSGMESYNTLYTTHAINPSVLTP